MTGLVNCKSSALTTRPPSLPANMGPCHYEKVAPTYVPTLSDDGETHGCCINPPVSCSGHQISHKNLPLEFLFFWPQKEFRQISPKFKIHLILKLIVWFQEAFFIIRGTCKWLLSLTPNFLCLQQGGWANIGRGGGGWLPGEGEKIVSIFEISWGWHQSPLQRKVKTRATIWWVCLPGQKDLRSLRWERAEAIVKRWPL